MYYYFCQFQVISLTIVGFSFFNGRVPTILSPSLCVCVCVYCSVCTCMCARVCGAHHGRSARNLAAVSLRASPGKATWIVNDTSLPARGLFRMGMAPFL